MKLQLCDKRGLVCPSLARLACLLGVRPAVLSGEVAALGTANDDLTASRDGCAKDLRKATGSLEACTKARQRLEGEKSGAEAKATELGRALQAGEKRARELEVTTGERGGGEGARSPALQRT